MTLDDAQKQAVDTATSKAEKASWKRKQKNIDKLVAELEPLEDSIMEIMTAKNEILDKITVIRKQMVQECIHPHDQLVVQGDGSILCKFCDKTLGIVQRSE